MIVLVTGRFSVVSNILRNNDNKQTVCAEFHHYSGYFQRTAESWIEIFFAFFFFEVSILWITFALFQSSNEQMLRFSWPTWPLYYPKYMETRQTKKKRLRFALSSDSVESIVKANNQYLVGKWCAAHITKRSARVVKRYLIGDIRGARQDACLSGV